YYDVKKNQLHDIPYPILRSTYGSNGICAGNTPYEALVQGISEIFERYVNIKIIKEKITPPTVPMDFIKEYPYLYRMITEIESMGNYRVIVKDCSLGRGFPVICIILSDLDNQTYRVKFGAHPSLKIALERSLTEMFQGFTLKQAATANSFFYGPTGLYDPINLQNIVKTATGFYPFEFFSESFSYEFKPFPDIEGKDNKTLVKELFNLLTLEGFNLYIRDVSYLGFPSFHLIAPGCSEIYEYDLLTMKERATKFRIEEVMRNLHDADEEDLTTLVLFIRYKLNSVLENSLSFIYRLPLKENFFGGIESFRFLLALTLYKLGKFSESISEMNIIIKKLTFTEIPDLTLITHIKCMRDFIAMKAENRDEFSILKKFYPEDVFNSTVEKMQDRQKVFNHFYEKTNCWDCSNCQAKNNCLNEIVSDVHLKLKAVHSENSIDQMDNQNIFEPFL
ncbi:MAG: YcaO-like family protein, partial [Spirochaetaceae bacterium]|nr:YcaO-like family protein [Spirochaetaceae bacterium]